MKHIALFGVLAFAGACADPLTVTEPEIPPIAAAQTSFGDTTLQLYLNPIQQLQPGSTSAFVHLRVLVNGTALPASHVRATFTSNNTAIIALPSGYKDDDDRTRVHALANGSASVTGEWLRNGKRYRTSQQFTVGPVAAIDTIVQLHLNPARPLAVGDNSVFVHARVLIGGQAIPASHTLATFTSGDNVVLGVPGGGKLDDDRTRLYPYASGTARLTAHWTANGKVYRGSRDFTVGGGSPSPPPPGSSIVNECAAPKTGWIWCDDFEADRTASYFEYVSASGRFTRAAGIGLGGSSAMRTRFDAGVVGAGNLKVAFGRTPASYFRTVDGGTANHRDIYWRVFVYYAPGWQGGHGHKMSRATVFAGSNWSQAMIAHTWGGGNAVESDPASGTDAAGNLRTTKYNDFANLRWLGMRRTTTTIAAQTGVWHCVESRARLNDAGQSNGISQIWINGVLEAQRTDLNWLGSYSAYGINAVFLENYWNGGAPKTQERYYDNFVVSTRRIGCG